MGSIKKGILGGFSGKVGTVVGANWKSTNYIRSLPQNMKNPRTVGQRTQRSKMALVVTLLRQLITVLRIGWKLYAKRQSAFNACTAYTLANAIKGTFPNFTIDYPKVMISRGNLTSMFNPKVLADGVEMRITWADNSEIGDAKPTDKLLFAMVNPTKNESVVCFDDRARSHMALDVEISTHWVGDKVHLYAGFASEDGKEVANSVYLGEITIQTT